MKINSTLMLIVNLMVFALSLKLYTEIMKEKSQRNRNNG